MKKFLQFLVSLFGYNIIKSSNFYKINRTLDQAIKSIIKKKIQLFLMLVLTKEKVSIDSKIYFKILLFTHLSRNQKFLKN